MRAAFCVCHLDLMRRGGGGPQILSGCEKAGLIQAVCLLVLAASSWASQHLSAGLLLTLNMLLLI
jgi:hypothetical protein